MENKTIRLIYPQWQGADIARWLPNMDVMNPSDILAAVADGPEGGLKLKEVVRLINDISQEKELIALTIAEPMPRIAIRLKQMLSELPLL